MFDHFVGLALKGLKTNAIKISKNQLKRKEKKLKWTPNVNLLCPAL